MNKLNTKLPSKKQIIETEERQLWIAVATAVARALNAKKSDTPVSWADAAADAFRERYNKD